MKISLAPLCATLFATVISAAVTNHARASIPFINDELLTSLAAAPDGGFWVQVDNGFDKNSDAGETFAINGAPAFHNIPIRGSIAAIPGRNGYWVVTGGGEGFPVQIIARGDAPHLCDGLLSNCSGFPKNPGPSDMIVGAAATPLGRGLWAVDRKGRVWTAGDAQPYGDVQKDTSIPTGIVATPSGKGYYIVQADGGVFSFGDAVFHGSTGGKKPGGHDVTGIALSIGDDGKVNGYWLVADDGAVYTFGQAPFWGNAGINSQKVTSIVSFPAPTPHGPPQRTRGYSWVFEHGGVGSAYGTFWLARTGG
jgi:hypothetical protein